MVGAGGETGADEHPAATAVSSTAVNVFGVSISYPILPDWFRWLITAGLFGAIVGLFFSFTGRLAQAAMGSVSAGLLICIWLAAGNI